MSIDGVSDQKAHEIVFHRGEGAAGTHLIGVPALGVASRGNALRDLSQHGREIHYQGLGMDVLAAVTQRRRCLPTQIVQVRSQRALVNAGTAALFMAGQRSDLNIRGAFLHLAADAAVSVGVVIAGAVIFYTGWLIIDPLMSLVVAIVILAVRLQDLLHDRFEIAHAMVQVSVIPLRTVAYG